MMRTTGFLVGICLTVAAFLLILDIGTNQQQETLTETIPAPTQEQLSVMVAAIAEQVDVVQAESESDLLVPPGSQSGIASTEPQSNFMEVTGNSAPEEPSDVVQTEPDHVSATPDDQPQNGFEVSSMEPDHRPINEVSSNTGTYLFWSPFRSMWAAQGFAGRLTLSTQVPVDVVNTGPGKYRVAFSYQDETERLARIERIETITGLKLE